VSGGFWQNEKKENDMCYYDHAVMQANQLGDWQSGDWGADGKGSSRRHQENKLGLGWASSPLWLVALLILVF